MKKIVFYIDNRAISDVDASEVKDGNPGIGGTEHLILLVSSLLSERENGLTVKLYMREAQRIPAALDSEVVESMSYAIQRAEEEGMDFFVLKHDATNVVEDALHTKKDLRFIVWCHVFVCYWELNYYAKNNAVYKIVFVGREMQDLYRDHRIFDKSTYIYNCVPLSGCREMVANHPYSQRGNVVTYVGSIVPFKGLHLLAAAWPKIIAEIPDAQLYIIGSGKLYESASCLGKFGIAETSYEELITKPLSIDGKLLPSVHFLGRMGVEKRDILLRTKVGVPNPTGITETFCLSAVEMQAFGARIATIKAPGYLDTVINGRLYTKPSALADTIVSLLKTETSDYEHAMSRFEKEFSYETVIKQWEDLFYDKNISVSSAKVNAFYRLKWLKECIRKISGIFPINHIIPPMERVLIFIERRILHKITFMDSNLSL